MAATKDVAVLVGSLRRGSVNRKLAKAVAELAPSSLKLEIVEIGDLPIYNADLDQDPPAAWRSLRARIKTAGAVLFVTPEYNRSVPAPLKNAIDVASRPYGQSAWDGKPIDRVREIMRLLGPESVGRTVDLSLIRGGVPVALKVVIGERPVK